jgi:hypothetical protein
VTSFAIFGSPANTRKLRADSQRVSDLQSIQWQVINYWQQKGSVPANMAALKDPISSFYMPTDPETGLAYTYEKVAAKSFKLCATFNLSNKGAEAGANPMMAKSLDGMMSENWQHTSGEYCFDRVIDADLYPVREATRL